MFVPNLPRDYANSAKASYCHVKVMESDPRTSKLEMCRYVSGGWCDVPHVWGSSVFWLHTE